MSYPFTCIYVFTNILYLKYLCALLEIFSTLFDVMLGVNHYIYVKLLVVAFSGISSNTLVVMEKKCIDSNII